MTADSAISAADYLLNNNISQAKKREWLTELDGRIYTELFAPRGIEIQDGNAWQEYIVALALGEAAGTPAYNAQLLIGFPYDSLYTDYLLMNIYLSIADINRYNNAAEIFTKKYADCTAWLNKSFGGAEPVGAGVSANEAIMLADCIVPNSVSAAQKRIWLAALDGKAYIEVLAPRGCDINSQSAWQRYIKARCFPSENAVEADYDSPLLISYPYDGIYVNHLVSQICLSFGDYSRYANEAQVFARLWADYTDYIGRTHGFAANRKLL